MNDPEDASDGLDESLDDLPDLRVEQQAGAWTLVLPRLYGKQRAFAFDPHRFTVVFATTKSGKSCGLLVWLVHQCWSGGRPGKEYHWVAPSIRQSKEMFRRVASWFRRADPEGRIWSSNETELAIVLGSGGRLVFKSGEIPDLLYGFDCHGAVIDEAPRQREEVFAAVASTVTATGGQIKLAGNMRGRKNWAYRLYLRGTQGDPDIGSHRLDYHDAIAGGVITEDAVELARRNLPAMAFQELYECVPGSDEGNPFGIDHIRTCIAPLGSAAPAAFGVDVASAADYTAIIGLDASGTVCRFDRFQLPWPQTRARIRAVIGQTATLIDSTGPGAALVQELREEGSEHAEGLEITGGNAEPYQIPDRPGYWRSAKQRLMLRLMVAIQQGEIRYPDGPIVSELESFEYAYSRTGVQYQAAQGCHDDCVLALSLAVLHASLHAGDGDLPMSWLTGDPDFQLAVLGRLRDPALRA